MRSVVVVSALSLVAACHHPQAAPAAPPAPPTPGDAVSPTADEVLATIQGTYMEGVKRCYKEQLKRDATLRGKVVLTFAVDATGAMTGEAHGFSADVDACIGAQIPSWKLPAPKDQAGTPTTASFSITLNLVPD